MLRGLEVFSHGLPSRFPFHHTTKYKTYSIPNDDPPRDDRGFTISGNLKSFQGPVLKCRDSRKHYLNELVILEIRNNASASSEIFFLPVVK